MWSEPWSATTHMHSGTANPETETRQQEAHLFTVYDQYERHCVVQHLFSGGGDGGGAGGGRGGS